MLHQPLPPCARLPTARCPLSPASCSPHRLQYKWVVRPLPPSTAPTRELVTGAPLARFLDLTPNTTYVASMTCATPTGQQVPANQTLRFTTSTNGCAGAAHCFPAHCFPGAHHLQHRHPCATADTSTAGPAHLSHTLPHYRSAPTIPLARPTSETQATVVVNPPASSADVSYYNVTVCLADQPTACQTERCQGTVCNFRTLLPGRRYTSTAIAVLAGGEIVPASNSVPFTMPDPGAPSLIDAQATGTTSGKAVATVPAGTTFDSYVFTYRPLNGGPSINVISPTLEAATGQGQLAPATQYEAR